MNGKCLSIGITLLFGLSGACLAAAPSSHGVIQFTGSIVESGCMHGIGADSVLEFNGCPRSSRGTAISAVRVAQVAEATALDHSVVGVKLVSDSGSTGRYYDQQYALIDAAGKPVRSGAYLITLTFP